MFLNYFFFLHFPLRQLLYRIKFLDERFFVIIPIKIDVVRVNHNQFFIKILLFHPNLYNISADKHTKSLREKQPKMMFNLLKIKYIKTTFFDLKDVVFVNKIADCRKSARARASTCRVG